MINCRVYSLLSLFLLVGWLCTACVTPSLSPDAPSAVATVAQTAATVPMGGAMQIEGVIVEIMESYPLQLVVETTSGPYQVALSEEVVITAAGAARQQGDLQRQMRVRITGDRSGANAIMAHTMEILATP